MRRCRQSQVHHLNLDAGSTGMTDVGEKGRNTEKGPPEKGPREKGPERKGARVDLTQKRGQQKRKQKRGQGRFNSIDD